MKELIKVITTSLVLQLLSTYANGQFLKTYLTMNNDIASLKDLTANESIGSYYLCGDLRPDGLPAISYGMIMNTNEDGSFQWSRIYQTNMGENLVFNSIAKAPLSNNYVIVGTKQGAVSDQGFMMGINGMGIPTFAFEFGNALEPDGFTCVRPVDNEEQGYIVIGHLNQTSLYVMLTDLLGNVNASTVIEADDPNIHLTGSWIEPNQDGGYSLVGNSVNLTSGVMNGFFALLDNGLNLVSHSFYSDLTADLADSTNLTFDQVLQADGSEYIIVGTSVFLGNSSLRMLSINETGDQTIFSRSYESDELQGLSGTSIVGKQDGNYFVAATGHDVISLPVLIEIEPSGDVVNVEQFDVFAASTTTRILGLESDVFAFPAHAQGSLYFMEVDEMGSTLSICQNNIDISENDIYTPISDGSHQNETALGSAISIQWDDLTFAEDECLSIASTTQDHKSRAIAYPNPATKYLIVELSEVLCGVPEFQFVNHNVNMDRVSVESIKLGSSVYKLETNHLEKGAYQLEMVCNGTVAEKLRIIIR